MSQQTVTFNLNVPYTDENGVDKTRTCVLTLTLTLTADDQPGSTEEAEGFRQITVQGAVIPVEDPKGGALTEEDSGCAEQQAA